jgi:hypothetical protein
MIAGLSKAVILYLAPVLTLTAILLSMFAFLAPAAMLHDRVALLTVTPSTSLIQPGPSQGVDGPSIFLGVLGTVSHSIARFLTYSFVLGSCSRVNNSAGVNCTSPTISPVYGEYHTVVHCSHA